MYKETWLFCDECYNKRLSRYLKNGMDVCVLLNKFIFDSGAAPSTQRVTVLNNNLQKCGNCIKEDK